MSGAITEHLVDGEVLYSAECVECEASPQRMYPTLATPRVWVTSHDTDHHKAVAAAKLTEQRKARERAAALRGEAPLPRVPEVDLYPRTRPVRASTVEAGDVVVLTRGAPQRVVAANTRDGYVTIAARHIADNARTPSLPLGTFHPDAVLNKAVSR